MPKNPKKSVAPPNGQSRITPRVSRTTARNPRRDRARRTEQKHFHSIDAFARATPHRRVRHPRHLHRFARCACDPKTTPHPDGPPMARRNATPTTSTRAPNDFQRRARRNKKSSSSSVSRRHLRHGDLTGERAARKGGCVAIVVEERVCLVAHLLGSTSGICTYVQTVYGKTPDNLHPKIYILETQINPCNQKIKFTKCPNTTSSVHTFHRFRLKNVKGTHPNDE